jgi:predicted pyridoxine 5'-phosphate oxidase superfamily flavin-nucleotide-binding protein
VGALTADARRVVEEQRLCFVATVNDDGTPNLSPKGTIAVLDDDHLVFGDIRSPRTVANLRRRPTVEINVLDPVGRMGFRFRGQASIVDGGEWYDRFIALCRERGTTNTMREIVVIAVERAEPVISPAYDTGGVESEIRAKWRAHYADLDAAHSS